MRTLKKLLSNLHRYVFLLMASVIVWAWVYNLCTETGAAKKVVVYIDSTSVSDAAMRAELNENKPEGIKIIKVYPFSYAFFSSGAPSDADIYIMPESDMDKYSDLLLPIDMSGEDFFIKGGKPLGIRIFNASENTGAATSFIDYSGAEPQDYYICINRSSVHAGGENSADRAAFEVIETILALP